MANTKVENPFKSIIQSIIVIIFLIICAIVVMYKIIVTGIEVVEKKLENATCYIYFYSDEKKEACFKDNENKYGKIEQEFASWFNVPKGVYFLLSCNFEHFFDGEKGQENRYRCLWEHQVGEFPPAEHPISYEEHKAQRAKREADDRAIEIKKVSDWQRAREIEPKILNFDQLIDSYYRDTLDKSHKINFDSSWGINSVIVDNDKNGYDKTFVRFAYTLADMNITLINGFPSNSDTIVRFANETTKEDVVMGGNYGWKFKTKGHPAAVKSVARKYNYYCYDVGEDLVECNLAYDVNHKIHKRFQQYLKDHLE